MITSGWAGVFIALALMVGTFGGALWRGGRREGQLAEILENLQNIVRDHETRIREQERSRRR